MSASRLTDDERAIAILLGKAWDAFLRLPVEHGDDLAEFRHAIHRAQDMVLARPGRRQINSTAEQQGYRAT